MNDVDVLPLLGLDVLDEHHLLADTVSNNLVEQIIVAENGYALSYVVDDWKVPMKRLDKHVYVHMKVPYKILYTRRQLEEIHRNCFHPSSKKLYKLICCTRPYQVTPRHWTW